MVNQLFVFLSLILLQYSNCLCLAETSATQAVPLAGTRGTQRQEQASALQQAAGGGHPLSHFAPPRHHIGHGGRRDRWTAPPGWDHPHRNNGWRGCLALGCALHVPSLCLLAAPWYVSWLRLGWAHSQTPDRSRPQSQSVEETQMQKHQQLPNLLEAKRPRIKMPSFEAVSICRAGHSIVVQYVLRNWKCKSIVQIC